MTHLCVFHNSNPLQPIKLLNHFDDIARELAEAGVELAQLNIDKPGSSTGDQLLQTYQQQVHSLQQKYGLADMDVFALSGGQESSEARQKYLREHSHNQLKLRLIVAGRARYYLHINEQVYALQCSRGDLLVLPAGLKHWFDAGEQAEITMLRGFVDKALWQTQFCAEDSACKYLLLDD